MRHSSRSSSVHERAAQSIPWLLNGTLPADEAAELHAHLAHCPHCRCDYELEKRIYEAIRDESPLVLTGEPSFAKLMARIEAQEDAIPDDRLETPEPHATSPVTAATGAEPPAQLKGHGARPMRGNTAHPRKDGRARAWHKAAVRWLAAAVVIEAALLARGPWPSHAPQPAPYQTLTSPAPHYGAGPRIRVVFNSNLTLEALQKLLRMVDAHIVDGPTDAQVYTLGFSRPVTSAELEARIATLRASSQVLFAEIASQDSDSR